MKIVMNESMWVCNGMYNVLSRHTCGQTFALQFNSLNCIMSKLMCVCVCMFVYVCAACVCVHTCMSFKQRFSSKMKLKGSY